MGLIIIVTDKNRISKALIKSGECFLVRSQTERVQWHLVLVSAFNLRFIANASMRGTIQTKLYSIR